MTRFGIVVDEHVTLGAAFAAEPGGGPPATVVAWRETPLRSAHLVMDGAWLVYASEGPEPGWYAVPTQGAGASQGGARVMPAGAALDAGLPRPAFLAGALLALEAGVITAYPLDA